MTPGLAGVRVPTALPLLLIALLATGCGGVSELERCIEHSVEEGVDRALAEEGCRAALERDGAALAARGRSSPIWT